MPFESFPEKLKLAEGKAKSEKLKFLYPSSVANGNYLYRCNCLHRVRARPERVQQYLGVNGAGSHCRSVRASDRQRPTAPTFNGAKPALVSLTLKNDGNEQANATSAIEFFATTNGTLTGAISLATSPLHISLKPSAAKAFKVKLALPPALPAGTYMLLASGPVECLQ